MVWKFKKIPTRNRTEAKNSEKISYTVLLNQYIVIVLDSPAPPNTHTYTHLIQTVLFCNIYEKKKATLTEKCFYWQSHKCQNFVTHNTVGLNPENILRQADHRHLIQMRKKFKILREELQISDRRRSARSDEVIQLYNLWRAFNLNLRDYRCIF